ncbi:AMP-binding protein [Rhodococcus sp. 3Y1]
METNRVANALLRDGVRPGDRVAYIGANAPSFLSVLYGSSKMGSILTAVNNRLAPGEVGYILSNSEPTVVVLGAGDEGLSDVAAAVGSVGPSSRWTVPETRSRGTTGFPVSATTIQGRRAAPTTQR